MIPAKYDIHCRQGTDLVIDWTFKRPDGSVQPLHGLSVHMGVKRYLEDSGAVMASWSTSTGEITIVPATGAVQLSVSAAETAALSSSGEYDMFFQTGTGGDAVKVCGGQFVLSKEVTR